MVPGYIQGGIEDTAEYIWESLFWYLYNSSATTVVENSSRLCSGNNRNRVSNIHLSHKVRVQKEN